MGIKHPVMGVDDLRTLNPVVAGEWFAEKNEGLNIADYVAGSAKRVWWKCSSCEHEWQTSIRARYQRGTGCPLCARIESGRRRTLRPCHLTSPPSAIQKYIGNAMYADIPGLRRLAIAFMGRGVQPVRAKHFMLDTMTLPRQNRSWQRNGIRLRMVRLVRQMSCAERRGRFGGYVLRGIRTRHRLTSVHRIVQDVRFVIQGARHLFANRHSTIISRKSTQGPVADISQIGLGEWNLIFTYQKRNWLLSMMARLGTRLPSLIVSARSTNFAMRMV